MIDRRGFLLAALVLAASAAACGPARSTATPAAPTPSPSAGAPTAAATAAATQPASSPAESATAGAPACQPGDLKASHGLIEGAAGSVQTQVVLEAGTACSVDATPILGLRDASGTGVVGATSSGPSSIDLAAGTAYTSDVRLANWCGADPVFPLTLVLRIDGAELAVTGTSFPEDGGLPPCLASGGPILQATPWVPSP